MPEVTVVKQPKQERPELSRWLGYFQQAIEADPTYAPAYSGLADSYRGDPGSSGKSDKGVFP
jgi:hypothetical protein